MYFIRDNLVLRNIDGIYLIIDVENKYILDTMKENTLEEILTEYIYKYYN